MKHAFRCFGFTFCLIMTGAIFGQGNIDLFTLESKSVHVEYEIEVVIPPGSRPQETKYPVAYCLDWFILNNYLKSLPKLMELGRLAEPYILVGINQGQNADDWAAMRTRDYTPSHPTEEYSRNNMYAKALDMTGGAPKFSNFLAEELVPLIESKYPCDPDRRCFVGYSLGGLFGVYIMTENPQLFQYYLLGSPSLWFNDFYLTSKVEGMSKESFQKIQKIYLSVGEEESWEMLKCYSMLREAFREKGFEESRLKAEIINSSGHVGAMPISLYSGFRFLFRNN